MGTRYSGMLPITKDIEDDDSNKPDTVALLYYAYARLE